MYIARYFLFFHPSFFFVSGLSPSPVPSSPFSQPSPKTLLLVGLYKTIITFKIEQFSPCLGMNLSVSADLSYHYLNIGDLFLYT